jgi:hypothetical protein
MSVSTSLLFKALLEDVAQDLPTGFKPGDSWSPELDPRQVAAIALVNSVLKKFLPSDYTTDAQDAVAVEKFHRVNSRCSSWSLSPCTSLDEELMGEFKHLLYRFFYPTGTDSLLSGYGQIFDHGRHGPGSAVGALGTDFYTKSFSSPLLCTHPLIKAMYKHSLQNDHQSLWDIAESNREHVFGEIGFCEGSRFHFVPKDDSTSRMIAIEPSLNMFYQLGLGRLLENGLKTHFGLDLSIQPQINQQVALVGSVTDDLCTIDLSNASDSLAMPMLRWALPPSVMKYLEVLRSPCGTLQGERVVLHMVSTMGNGFTFPLETLVFTCCVLSALRSHHIKMERPLRDLAPVSPFVPYGIQANENVAHGTHKERYGLWGVFGDDIVCHREVVDRVLRLLDLLGFEVNREKSFVEGPFRESCGRDFFKGHDVRGVYIKSLHNVESRYAAINALNVWSAKTGIALVRTIQMLLTSVPRTFVPPEENQDAGIRVPFSKIQDLLPRDANQAIIYDRRISKPGVIRIGDGDIRVPKGAKVRIFNPEGLLIAFLGGSVKQGRIMVRQTKTRYRTKRGVTPRWNYVPPTSDIALLCGFPRWESAVEVNVD